MTPANVQARYRRARGPRRSSVALTAVMALMLIYTLLPLAWLLLSSTKNSNDLFTTFGLAPGHSFHLWQNIKQVFSVDGDIFLRWLGNTVLYVVIGAGGAAVIATAAGYGLAKYAFKGRRLLFAIVLGAISVPATALAVPTYLLWAKVGLINNPWGVIIPALCSPFGLYLMIVYTIGAVPDDLLEAARIDGAGEFRIFRTIALRLLAPGFVTVLLFAVVATWNNYFLPYIILNNPNWFPLTVGLATWNEQATGINGNGASGFYPLVITGSLLAIIPLIACFLFLQRYWQSGLAAGSVKQ
jgi:multiple sugar transport system permease protein